MEALGATRTKRTSAAKEKAKPKPKAGKKRTAAAVEQALPGRLVAVTATGPVVRADMSVVRLPVPSALAFLHELAVKADSPRARVVSSMAARLKGEDALCAWARTSALISRQLLESPVELRMAFLQELMTFTKRVRNVAGIESVHAAALNSVWPWLDERALERMLKGFAKRHAKSKFAAKHWIPVFDPTNRTVTVFAPGDLAKLDPGDWLNERAVAPPAGFGAPGGFRMPGSAPGRSGWDGGYGAPAGRGEIPGGWGTPGGFSPTTPGGFRMPGGAPGGFGWNGGLPGGLGWDGRGIPGGMSGLGVPGGRGGPDLSSYGGPDLSGNGEPQMPGGLSGLGVPGGDRRRPDMTSAGGPDLSGSGEPQLPDGMSGLGVPGGPLSGPGGLESLGQSGGPFGHGSYLGPEGAADKLSAEKAEGKSKQAFGIALFTGGLGLMAVGAVASGPVGTVLVVGGAVTAMGGVVLWGDGAQQEKQAERATPSATGSATPQPQGGHGTGGEHGTPAPAKPAAPEGTITIKPAQHPAPPEEPKKNDIYPDPYGTGGGNPTQLWDGDGGGGRPDTIWDDDMGGGRPNTIFGEDDGGGRPDTIWDKDGDGGGRPDTIWALHGGGRIAAITGNVADTTVLTGPGLLAGYVQVAPNTFAI